MSSHFLSHHLRNYSQEDAVATQMAAPHYLAEWGQGCCVSNDNPNFSYWVKKGASGKCAVTNNMAQCCGPAGERCVHNRDSLLDQTHGYNLWFAKN